MASITREKAIKWDTEAKKYGSFRFDIEYYVLWSEKALIKNIKHEDGTYTQHKIRYASEYVRENGTITEVHKPVHIVNTLYPLESGCYRVIQESSEVIGKTVTKKNYTNLCKLSATINLEEVA